MVSFKARILGILLLALSLGAPSVSRPHSEKDNLCEGKVCREDERCLYLEVPCLPGAICPPIPQCVPKSSESPKSLREQTKGDIRCGDNMCRDKDQRCLLVHIPCSPGSVCQPKPMCVPKFKISSS